MGRDVGNVGKKGCMYEVYEDVLPHSRLSTSKTCVHMTVLVRHLHHEIWRLREVRPGVCAKTRSILTGHRFLICSCIQPDTIPLASSSIRLFKVK